MRQTISSEYVYVKTLYTLSRYDKSTIKLNSYHHK